MPEIDEPGRIQPVGESDRSPGGADVEDLARTVFQCEQERRRLERQLASLAAQAREQQASALADLRSAADQVEVMTARAEEQARAAQDAAQEARAAASNAHARAASLEDRARSAEAQLAAVLNSRSYRLARMVSSAAHPRQMLAARRVRRA